ncbi:MAG: fibronectin type III domain-containing protein [Thermoplasmata archaeon]|nr:fibronectin type III domain-containing protein [Thermoplasmata archaeon]
MAVIGLALIVLAPGWLPSGGTAKAAERITSLVPAAPTGASPPPAIIEAPSNSGPVGGRFFTAPTIALNGVVNSVSGLAVDPATRTVYAANTNAGTVTSFGEVNGTLLHSIVVANVLSGSFPFALALDAPNGSLYVSVSNRYAGIAGAAPSGWVLALNAATLSIETNFTFPTYPTPPFEPSFMAFDGATRQLFVENASGGTVAAIDIAAGALRTYIDCGVMQCADHGYGLLDIPSLHDLIIPTCQEQLVVVSTQNDSVAATITGPPTTIMAWAAFDSRSGMLWVENYTFNQANGTLLKVDLASDQIVANVPGIEPREAAMIFDPIDNVLVTSDVNGSEQLSTYNATTGARIASSAGTPGAAHPFKTLAVDAVHALVVAGGPGNGTTRSFSVPTLAPLATYSSFPASFAGVGVDPTTGIAVLLGRSPGELWGVNETTGSTAYVVPLPSGESPSSLSVDPTTGRAYLADESSGAVDVYESGNGTLITRFHPLTVGAIPGMLLSVDPAHHRLYLADPSAHSVSVLALPGGSVLGTVPVPGVVVCALAADPPLDSAFVSNCGGAGNVTQVSGGSLGRIGATSVGPNPSALSVNLSGDVFVLDGTGTHVAILQISASSVFEAPGVNLPGRATVLTVDDRDGLLLTSGGPAAGLSVFTLSNRSFAGVLPLRAPSGGLLFDPARGVVVAPELDGGAGDLLGILAAPSPPTALSASPGNSTLSISWGAPSSPGASAATTYTISIGPIGGENRSAYLRNSSPFALTGLTNGEPYLVRASATSVDGTGPESVGVVATAAGVPFPTTNLSATLAGSTVVDLAWTAPTVDDGAPVTAYTVNVTGGPGSGLFHLGDVTQGAVDGLSPGATYRFAVSAVNSAGEGHPGTGVTVTTAATPFPVLLVVGATACVAAATVIAVVVIRRRPPSGDDDGGTTPSG